MTTCDRRLTRDAPADFYDPWVPSITSGFMDGKPMELPCSTCGTSLHTTVGEARRAASLQCPNGHPLTFDAEEFDESIRRSEQRVQDIMNRFTF